MKTRFELLQGVNQLAGDGLLGAVDVVEDMHLAIVAGIGRFVPLAGGVAPAARFTYARVRDAVRLGRRAADATAGLLRHRLPDAVRDDAVGPTPLAWLAALNGAIGDRLAASGNPLALRMGLYRDGIEAGPRAPVGRAIEAADGTLLVFVHGLGMNDLQWRDARGNDFGAHLERERVGFALHLRYNSGLRISANGREFSHLLQALHECHAPSIRRIVLIGHSMGGLVCRSACAHAERHRLGWAATLDQVVCLGTPHLGAPLERLGNALGALLATTPYTRSLAAVADVRSEGVKDLRHGWASDHDRDGVLAAAGGRGLPFADRVQWRLAAATRSARSTGARARWLGDGLVPVPSALGEHEDPARALALPASHRRVFTRHGHLDLLTGEAVLAQVRDWISPRRRPARAK
ncbi:esterase/lipase family protein [Dokdonella sp.]|uniref:esterase/lipase family protein n=1 Tax=Dokdonella sp. TaxID=2291710 RepID=UPI002F42D692